MVLPDQEDNSARKLTARYVVRSRDRHTMIVDLLLSVDICPPIPRNPGGPQVRLKQKASSHLLIIGGNIPAHRTVRAAQNALRHVPHILDGHSTQVLKIGIRPGVIGEYLGETKP